MRFRIKLDVCLLLILKYVITHNPEIDPLKVELCSNSMEYVAINVLESERKDIRQIYGIPLKKTVFVYGGNLGKPQGVPFLIECLRACQSIDEAFFLIVGSGTDYGLLEKYVVEKEACEC